MITRPKDIFHIQRENSADRSELGNPQSKQFLVSTKGIKKDINKIGDPRII